MIVYQFSHGRVTIFDFVDERELCPNLKSCLFPLPYLPIKIGPIIIILLLFSDQIFFNFQSTCNIFHFFENDFYRLNLR